jgi:hypothetical protein
MIILEPGTYYQDILEDGTRSVLRQNFEKLQRVSFDKRPPVVRTLKITVEDLEEEPLLLTQEVYVTIPTITDADVPKESVESLKQALFGKT